MFHMELPYPCWTMSIRKRPVSTSGMIVPSMADELPQREYEAIYHIHGRCLASDGCATGLTVVFGQAAKYSFVKLEALASASEQIL